MKNNILSNHNNLCETHKIGKNTRERIVYSANHPFMCEIGMSMVGISTAPIGFAFERHNPTHFQFLACLHGEGDVLMDDQLRPCSQNHAYLTPAIAHHAYLATQKQPWEVCWVVYETNHWRELLGLNKPVLCEVQTQPIHAAIGCLHTEAVGPADQSLMRQWVLLIDQLVQRACKPWQSPSRLWQLWQAVDSNLAHAWDNDTLAEMLGMSNEHLRRLCQQEIGHAPMQQVTKLRMQRAAHLLRSTPMSITQIASLVGYENAFAFSTAFKRFFALNPSTFRQKS
jgi:AraC-like DNA-binding protein